MIDITDHDRESFSDVSDQGLLDQADWAIKRLSELTDVETKENPRLFNALIRTRDLCLALHHERIWKDKS